MLSSKNFILDLLQMSKEQEEIAIESLVKQTKLSPQNVFKIIQNLNEELTGFMEIEKNLITIPKKSKMKLVKKALSLGISLGQIIPMLHWKEFENFCFIVLDHHEFFCIQNYYFTHHKKRYEIDVIGIKKPLIFAIDAKKWKTGHASALKTMVKNQIRRVKAFSKSIMKRSVRDKLNLTNWQNAKIIPMIVTSKMYEIKIFEHVPILPFFKLNKFLNEYHRYSEMILQFPVNLSAQKTLHTKKVRTVNKKLV